MGEGCPQPGQALPGALSALTTPLGSDVCAAQGLVPLVSWGLLLCFPQGHRGALLRPGRGPVLQLGSQHLPECSEAAVQVGFTSE